MDGCKSHACILVSLLIRPTTNLYWSLVFLRRLYCSLHSLAYMSTSFLFYVYGMWKLHEETGNTQYCDENTIGCKWLILHSPWKIFSQAHIRKPCIVCHHILAHAYFASWSRNVYSMPPCPLSLYVFYCVTHSARCIGKGKCIGRGNEWHHELRQTWTN